MEKYARVGREVRALMFDLTPLVEPVSIDEAFMDLSGTARLHGMWPAKTLAGFAARVERELGITVSIGLSCNKFLAKIASDLDKPRGFKVLGGGEAAGFLAPRPVTQIFGVGNAAQARLAREGLRTVGDLQRAGESALRQRYGAEGVRLFRLAHGRDDRPVHADRETKSVSAETTFDRDISEYRPLEQRLWRLCEKVSARLKDKELAGATVTLKLKTADFRLRTRAQTLSHPTQLAAILFATGRDLLAPRDRRHQIPADRHRRFVAHDRPMTPTAATSSIAAQRKPSTRSIACANDFGDEAVVVGRAFGAEDDD